MQYVKQTAPGNILLPKKVKAGEGPQANQGRERNKSDSSRLKARKQDSRLFYNKSRAWKRKGKGTVLE